jgi:glycerol-3-phosphate dehydrogenase subunit C
MVCPVGVRIAEMNARARASLVKDGRVPLRLRLRNNLVSRAASLGKFAQPFAPIANRIFTFPPARLIAEKALGIHSEAPFPPFAQERFTTWFRKHEKPTHSTRQVAYFHGCSSEYYEPRVGRAAVHVLEALGFEVLVPPQNCCGLPLLSNGEFPAARRYHQNNVKHLLKFVQSGIPIVGTSTSCTLTLKEEAPELLDMHDADTRAIARTIYDFNEFLLMLWEQGEIELNPRPLPLRLVYHIPCQYRAHRIGKPGLEILKMIPELELVDSGADCCGIAGTYGYKTEKYDISMQVGEPLFQTIRQVGGPMVICDSETCRWQITHATGIPCVHPVELLASCLCMSAEGLPEYSIKGEVSK